MSSSAGPRSVCIAGGGIIGLSIGWRLAQQGCRVTIFEKGRLGREASWAAAGMLAPGGEFTSASEQAATAIESRNSYRTFIRELERAADQPIDYQDCGALELAFSEAELEALKAKAAAQMELGIESKPVSPAHAATFWPHLTRHSLYGARFYPNDGLVDPRDVLRALITAAGWAGVVSRERCRVDRMDVGPEGVLVASPRGEEAFDAAVLAAGAWSSSIAVNGVPTLPAAHPVKGQLIAYKQPEQTCSTILRQGHHYMVQRSSGLLVVGASTERVGFDRELSPEVSHDLAEWAGLVLPHLTETTPDASWIGFRPETAAPVLGRWHSDRLFVAYGHFRNGILLTPVTASRIAAQVTSSLGMPQAVRA